MGKLSNHHSATTVKLLLLGNSGAGKTGALTSLVKEGYKLYILDYDNGLDSLASFVKAECPDKIDNVEYRTLIDKRKAAGVASISDGMPKAFSSGMKLLDRWKYKEEDGTEIDLGKSCDLDPKDSVVVIDSLTFMSNAAMDYVLNLQGRQGQQPQIQDWGEAMRMTEGMLGFLYGESFKPNVIMISHITYQEGDNGSVQGYPSALGSKLPPKVGRYFNAVLSARVKGTGASAKRIIRTQSEGFLELKNPIGPKCPLEFPLSSGLADYFKLARGEK